MTNDQMKKIIEKSINDLNALGTLLYDLGVYQIAINAPTISNVGQSILEEMDPTPKFVYEASILAYAMEELPFYDKEACQLRPYGKDSFQASLEFGGIFFVCILSYDQAIKMFPEQINKLEAPESEIIEFNGKRFQLIKEDPADGSGES